MTIATNDVSSVPTGRSDTAEEHWRIFLKYPFEMSSQGD